MANPSLEVEGGLGAVVCGVDEVGRGCLAGPVVAAAVVVPPACAALLAGVRDSKALSHERRVALDAVIRAHCQVGLGEASVEEVDRLDVLRATFLAMTRAVGALPSRPDHALIDGNRVPPRLGVPATALVRGDARSLSVAAASIVAKVARDAAMARLDAGTPGYGWADNAGYGTAAHLEALGRLGVSPHHRRTFGGVRELLSPQGAFAF